ncbi:hypothetical protein OROHE_000936 [Orobanche hederae]
MELARHVHHRLNPSTAVLHSPRRRHPPYPRLLPLRLLDLISSLSTTTNLSGTLLAPPVFAFSSAAARFLNNRRPPPRRSISLLLCHTIKPPLVLTCTNLSSRDDRDEFRTLHSITASTFSEARMARNFNLSGSVGGRCQNPPARSIRGRASDRPWNRRRTGPFARHTM